MWVGPCRKGHADGEWGETIPRETHSLMSPKQDKMLFFHRAPLSMGKDELRGRNWKLKLSYSFYPHREGCCDIPVREKLPYQQIFKSKGFRSKASHPRLCFVASLGSMAQHCYLLCYLHFTQFYHQPGFLPINKVRLASVFIIALIILREKSELSQDVCYKLILSFCS